VFSACPLKRAFVLNLVASFTEQELISFRPRFLVCGYSLAGMGMRYHKWDFNESHITMGSKPLVEVPILQSGQPFIDGNSDSEFPSDSERRERSKQIRIWKPLSRQVLGIPKFPSALPSHLIDVAR
jgi:hypothetical protein